MTSRSWNARPRFGLAVLAVVVIALSACRPPIPADGNPPPVKITGDNAVSHDLQAWTWCYVNVCADGGPPADLPDIGDAREVVVEFPLQGWRFDAEFAEADEDCPRQQTVPVEQTGPTSHLVRPAGQAGTYDVTLGGFGDGDLVVTFRWTTTAEGPLPQPAARLGFIAVHDGTLDSFGVELELSNLAETPSEATALISMTAANCASKTFRPNRVTTRCSEGLVYWDEPPGAGLLTTDSELGPFAYHAVVTLDGVEYVAEATWPDDLNHDHGTSVALRFTPDLPALR